LGGNKSVALLAHPTLAPEGIREQRLSGMNAGGEP
jgi:hypothetical protein